MDQQQSYGVIVPRAGYRSSQIFPCFCANSVLQKTQHSDLLVLVLGQTDVQRFLELSSNLCVLWLEEGSWEGGSAKLHLSYRQQSSSVIHHKTIPLKSGRSVRVSNHSSKMMWKGENVSIVCKVPMPVQHYERMYELVQKLQPRLERLLAEVVALDSFVPKQDQRLLSDVAKKQQLVATLTQEGLEFYKFKPGGIQKALVKINLERAQMEFVSVDRNKSGLSTGLALWKQLRSMFYIPFSELFLRSIYEPIECLNDVMKQLSPREVNRSIKHMSMSSLSGIKYSIDKIQNGTLDESCTQMKRFVEMDIESDADVLESWVDQGIIAAVVCRLAMLDSPDENSWKFFQTATQVCLMVLKDAVCGKQAAGHFICSLDAQLQKTRNTPFASLYCLLMNCIELNHVRHAAITMHLTRTLVDHLQILEFHMKSKMKQYASSKLSTKQQQQQQQQQQSTAKKHRQKTIVSNDTAKTQDSQVNRTNSERSLSELPTSSIRTIHETEEFLEEQTSANSESMQKNFPSSTVSAPIVFPSSANSAPLSIPVLDLSSDNGTGGGVEAEAGAAGRAFKKSQSMRASSSGNKNKNLLNIPRLALGEAVSSEGITGIGGLTRSTRRTLSSTSSINRLGQSTHRTIHSSISHIEQDAVGSMNLVAQALGSSLFAADLAGFVAHRRMATSLGDCGTPSSRAPNTSRSSVSDRQSSSRVHKYTEDELLDKPRDFLIDSLRSQWGKCESQPDKKLPLADWINIGSAILYILIKLSPMYFPRIESNCIMGTCNWSEQLVSLLLQSISFQLQEQIEGKICTLFQRLLILGLTTCGTKGYMQQLSVGSEGIPQFGRFGNECIRIFPVSDYPSDPVLQGLSEVIWRLTGEWGKILPSQQAMEVVMRSLNIVDDYMQKSWLVGKGFLFLKYCGELMLRIEMVLSMHGEVEQWPQEALALMESLLKLYTSLLNSSKYDSLLLGLLLSLLFDSHESSGRVIDYAEICLCTAAQRISNNCSKDVSRDMKLGLLKFMSALFSAVASLPVDASESVQHRIRQTTGLFQGVFDPVKGSALQMIDRVASSTSGNIQVELAMLQTLKAFFEIQLNPVLTRDEWMNQYIQTLFLVFAKTYHRDNVNIGDSHLEGSRVQVVRAKLDKACSTSLQILLQILTNQSRSIRRRFYQLRLMDFLIRELALEYEFSGEQQNSFLQTEETVYTDPIDTRETSSPKVSQQVLASRGDVSPKVTMVPSLTFPVPMQAIEKKVQNENISKAGNIGDIQSQQQIFLTPKETFQPESPHVVERRGPNDETILSREGSGTLEDTWDISIGGGLLQESLYAMPSDQIVAGSTQSIPRINDFSDTFDGSTWDISIAKGARQNQAPMPPSQLSNPKMAMPLLFTGEQDQDYVVLKSRTGDKPPLKKPTGPLSHPSLQGLPIPSQGFAQGEGLFQKTLELVNQKNQERQQQQQQQQQSLAVPKLAFQQPKNVIQAASDVQESAVVPRLSLFSSVELGQGHGQAQQQQINDDDNSDFVPSTPTDTDIGHSARGSKMQSGPIGRTNSAHQSSYGQQRLQRRVYTIEGLHLTSLCIVIQLMLTKEKQLDAAYCDSQPFEKGMYNIPFILQHHLNHPQNEYILSALSEFVHKTGAAARNLYKLLVKHSYADTLYNQVGSRIGRGAYGSIVQCRMPDELGVGKQVALKKVDVPKFVFDHCTFVDVFREAQILEQFKSSNQICKLYDVGVSNDTYFLVLKYYKCSLKSWRTNIVRMCSKLSKAESLGDRLALYLNIFKQVVDAVANLVAANVVHFDLKCDNMLLEVREGIPEQEFWNPPTPIPPFQVVIADFGEAQQWGKGQEVLTTRNRGTECIKSPEMLMVANAEKKGRDTYDRRKKQGSGLPSDIWSLGCLLYELVTGDFMFSDTDWVKFFVHITSPEQAILSPHHLSKLRNLPIVRELLEYMLIRDPIRRPSLDNVRVKLEQLMASVYMPVYHPNLTSAIDPIPERTIVEEFDHALLQDQFLKPTEGAVDFYETNLIPITTSVFLGTAPATACAPTLTQQGITDIILLHEVASEVLQSCMDGKQEAQLEIDTKSKIEEIGNVLTAARVANCEIQTVSLELEDDALYKFLPLLLRIIQKVLGFSCVPKDFPNKSLLQQETVGKVVILGCDGCAGDAQVLAVASCMMLQRKSAYEALVYLRSRYLGLNMDARQLSMLMQWSNQRRKIQRFIKMGIRKATCLCGCCRWSIIRKLDEFSGPNPVRCCGVLDSESNCFINCRALMEGLEHRYGYMTDYMEWGRLKQRDFYIDPLSPLQRLELSQPKATKQLFKQNMEVYICGVCSVVVLAIRKPQRPNELEGRLEEEYFVNLNWQF